MNKRLFLLVGLLLFIPLVTALNPSISPFSKTIEVGETARFTTNIPKGEVVFWSVARPEFIQLLQSSVDGVLVKALKTGRSAVTVKTSTGRKASAIVFVGDVQNVNKAKRKIGAAREVIVSPQQRTVPVGASISFLAKMAKDRVFEWRVDHEDILTIKTAVGSRATIQALKEGTAHVFARAKDGSVGDAVVHVVSKNRPAHAKGLQRISEFAGSLRKS